MENKRDFTRAVVGVEAEIVAAESLVRGHVGDVSLKGLFLVCDEMLPEGAECIVHLLLGDPGASRLCVEARGRVIRNLDSGIAVEFTGIDLDSYGHLKNLVSMNAADIDQVEREFQNHLGLKRVKEL